MCLCVKRRATRRVKRRGVRRATRRVERRGVRRVERGCGCSACAARRAVGSRCVERCSRSLASAKGSRGVKRRGGRSTGAKSSGRVERCRSRSTGAKSSGRVERCRSRVASAKSGGRVERCRSRVARTNARTISRCVAGRSVKRCNCTKNGTGVSGSVVDSRPSSGQRAIIFFDDNVVNTENRCCITLNKYLGGFFYSRTIKDFNSQLTNHIPNMACRKPRAARWRCRDN